MRGKRWNQRQKFILRVGIYTGAYMCAVASEIHKCHSLDPTYFIFDTASHWVPGLTN